MNWEVISQYLPLYQKAMWLTLRIGWMGIAFSIIIGLICALIVHYKIPVARQIVKIYIELFRNTPLLVQLFLSISDCRRWDFPSPRMSAAWRVWRS